jgi:hypothetical protein
MEDRSHSDTCVPFAVSKVLAISQDDAGDLLFAEHSKQLSTRPWQWYFLGDARQGYHHNVIQGVLWNGGFKMVRILDSQYINAVNVGTDFPIFVYGQVNFGFTPFDKPSGLWRDEDCKKANYHGVVDLDPAGKNRRGHGYHNVFIDVQRRLHCLNLFDEKSRKHFDIDAKDCLPMKQAQPSEWTKKKRKKRKKSSTEPAEMGQCIITASTPKRKKRKKRKKSSTEPAEMGQCIITASAPMAYFRNIQRMWWIEKRQPTNYTE